MGYKQYGYIEVWIRGKLKYTYEFNEKDALWEKLKRLEKNKNYRKADIRVRVWDTPKYW
jgi:hypothetical protein